MATPYMNGGVVAVRLTDVPLKIRRYYGAILHERAARDGDIELALRLRIAVEQPSDRVYWLPAEKVTEVRRKQKW